MKWVIRILLSLLTLGWMIFIFGMSAAKGEESSGMSAKAAEFIGEVLHGDLEDWPEEERSAYIEKLEFPIRKSAHFLEYTMLGLLLSLTLKAWGMQGGKCFVTALLIGVAYAASDELHQLFVSGRSGQFTDVLIDSAGVFLGSGILYLWKRGRKTI